MTRHVPGAIGLALALTLTACGGTAQSEDGAGASVTADAAFPRTVQHAMGGTEIPERPERVVVLDTGELDTALSLGVTPVGAVTTGVTDDFLSYLADDAADVEPRRHRRGARPRGDRRAPAGPDPVQQDAARGPLRAAQPDRAHRLRRARRRRPEGELPAGRGSAGTGAGGRDVPRGLRGRRRRAGGGDRRPGRDDGQRTAVRRRDDPGLHRGVVHRHGQYPTFAELAAEEVTRADTDIVLYSSFGPAADSGEAAVVAGPLWPLMGAVGNDRAHAVDDDVFFTGIGLRAATLQLAALRELLVG
jgi:iron complex transport system substrate-binding protein